MAAPYNPPIKNEDMVLYVALESLSIAGSFKSAPTISTGDFKVGIDDATLNDISILPSVSPSGSIWVKIQLSATEMNGDNVKIQGIDQTTPKEWADFAMNIPTTSS